MDFEELKMEVENLEMNVEVEYIKGCQRWSWKRWRTRGGGRRGRWKQELYNEKMAVYVYIMSVFEGEHIGQWELCEVRPKEYLYIATCIYTIVNAFCLSVWCIYVELSIYPMNIHALTDRYAFIIIYIYTFFYYSFYFLFFSFNSHTFCFGWSIVPHISVAECLDIKQRKRIIFS